MLLSDRHCCSESSSTHTHIGFHVEWPLKLSNLNRHRKGLKIFHKKKSSPILNFTKIRYFTRTARCSDFTRSSAVMRRGLKMVFINANTASKDAWERERVRKNTKNVVYSFIHSFHWHVQSATIPCRSHELLPFLSVMYFFLPPFSTNYSSIFPHFILSSISWSTSQSRCAQIHIQYSFGNSIFFHSPYMSKPT
jgi:hypothetical protein